MKSINTPNADLLHSQNNADQNNNKTSSDNKPELNYDPAKYPPFIIVTHNNKHHAQIGNYKITESYDDMNDLIQFLHAKPWNVILNTITAVQHAMNKHPELFDYTPAKQNDLL